MENQCITCYIKPISILKYEVLEDAFKKYNMNFQLTQFEKKSIYMLVENTMYTLNKLKKIFKDEAIPNAEEQYLLVDISSSIVPYFQEHNPYIMQGRYLSELKFKIQMKYDIKIKMLARKYSHLHISNPELMHQISSYYPSAENSVLEILRYNESLYMMKIDIEKQKDKVYYIMISSLSVIYG